MRHLDLFSGIGGFALSASRVWAKDHEIVSFCEIEKYPQKVLAKHWPDVPCHDDIKTLKGDSFGAIDLITGGFPEMDVYQFVEMFAKIYKIPFDHMVNRFEFKFIAWVQ